MGLMYENFKMALSSVKANKMRAFLTMLGIIIGISSVMTITSIGNAVSDSLDEAFKGFGKNRIVVYINYRNSDDIDEGKLFSTEDIDNLKEGLGDKVTYFAPFGSSEKELKNGRRKAKIGFVFQTFNLISRTSSLKNVELPMIYAKKNASYREERAKFLLEQVGLSDRLHHVPNELSGGQRQRVAIARALANDPPIIFADEPTGNLDSKSSVEIMQIFTRLNDEGKTVIVVTHEPDIAAYTKRIITFRDGNIMSEVINENRTKFD